MQKGNEMTSPPPTQSTPALPTARRPSNGQSRRKSSVQSSNQAENDINPQTPSAAPATPIHHAFGCLPHRTKLSRDPVKLAPVPSTSLKRKRLTANLQPIITRLRFELAPICALPDGAAHPEYPKTLLHYHCLTELQLDSMARWYHQWTDRPCVWTHAYPACMEWDADFLEWLGESRGSNYRVRSKKRKFGRFIGLLGCETPVEEVDDKNEFLREKDRVRIKSASDVLARRGFRRW